MSTASPPGSIGLKDPQLFRQACYIDGEWVDADAGPRIAVDNPATGEILGTVPDSGAAETRRAIDAAARAFAGWRAQDGEGARGRSCAAGST